jgi:hypothetical protein
VFAHTQIGGKYHRDDRSVFVLKRRLQDVSIAVSHPIADEIVALDQDHGYAFDPTIQSFYDVEKDYYHSIATSDFHVVCNRFCSELGYLGDSVALEIAYAMLWQRPIILLYPPRPKPGLDPYILRLLTPRFDLMNELDVLTIETEVTVGLVRQVVGQKVDYDVSPADASGINERVGCLLDCLRDESSC